MLIPAQRLSWALSVGRSCPPRLPHWWWRRDCWPLFAKPSLGHRSRQTVKECLQVNFSTAVLGTLGKLRQLSIHWEHETRLNNKLGQRSERGHAVGHALFERHGSLASNQVGSTLAFDMLTSIKQIWFSSATHPAEPLRTFGQVLVEPCSRYSPLRTRFQEHFGLS